MEVTRACLIFLLGSITTCVRLTASVHPPLTQDLYGKGMLGYAQGGVTLHQNALLPLLLVNPDFLKLYTENPSLASQYVTLLMHVGSLRANNNDCPAISRSCPSECYSISATGCIVCQCPKAQGSAPSSASSNSTHTGSSVSTAGNNNGCPAFPSQCDPNCLALDSMGCPICSCSKTQLAGGQSAAGSGSAGSPSKVNGCAPFPKNCSAECAHIDAMGCIVCSCSTGSSGPTGNNTSTLSSSSSSSSSQGNINGCQPFPKNCRVECAMVDARGCIVCSCPSTGSTNSTSTATQTATSGGNGINGCPPFPKNCDSACVQLNDMGCVICSCSHSSNNSTQTQTGVHQIGNYVSAQGHGTSGNVNGCPALDPKCPTECSAIDSQGCVRCSCPPGSTSSSTSSQSGSVSSSNAGGCPAIPKNCQVTCLNIDASGCVVCSCPSNTGVNGYGATCPPYKADDCDDVCKVTDTHGCPICDCSQHLFSAQSTTPGSVTSVPGAGGCPSFDFSTCDPDCVVMDAQGCMSCHCAATTPAPSGGQSNNTSGAVTSVPGAGGCPSFDFGTCDPNCVVMDDRGCLSCTCAATQAPSGGQTTTAGAVTSVPGAGGCPSFDFSTCDPNCVVMDAQGCMSCQCQATTAAPGKSTSAAVTSVPGAGGCPSFDFSTCDPSCVVMDAQGCMSCQCQASTAAPLIGQSTTSGAVTSVPGAGGCPSFDFSTCDPNCVVMDSQGCLSCHCAASQTTASPSQSTQQPGTTTSVPGAGGCPSFDFSKCDPNCVVMDAQGCLTCSCAATTPAAATSGSTASVTSVPGAGGCPSFDFSKCDPSCVVMDAQGCMTCSCSATTPAATSGSTAASVTSVPGAGGCPSFDFSKCDPSCVVMDAQGCMTCSCSGNQSGRMTTAPPPYTTTRRPTTARPTTTAPRITTTHAPSTTTGNTCPPIRCTYPCDLGVAFNALGCPVCKCRTSTPAP
uniref:Mucin-5AC-like isoform X2 n=1 Tax=Crassostrea virginica TaxID=6565 RepID=A0A8B8BQV4_CRAVI|nr:mucin-5AC-like isoform X2 [Crassostrea virginica]